jgi:hypothetical protein
VQRPHKRFRLTTLFTQTGEEWETISYREKESILKKLLGILN